MTHPQMEEERGGRILSVSVVAGFLALFGALAYPALFRQVYTEHDLGAIHLPFRWWFARALENGWPTAWMPPIYNGFYLQGSGEVGATHPLYILLYRTLPLDVAFNLQLLASYPIAFVGMGLFLRRRGLGWGSALYGGLVYAFGGWLFLHIIHMAAPMIAAHVPWILLALDRLLRAPERRDAAWAGAAVALLTASQLLTGHPQYVLYSLFAEGLYVLWVLLGERPPRWLRAAGIIILVKLLGLALGMPQLLPTWESGERSTRADPGTAYRLSYSLHPANLLQPLAPYAFTDRMIPHETETYGPTGNAHEFTLYAGGALPALFLAAWLAGRAKSGDERRRRSLAGYAGLLGVLGLLLAMGVYGGLYLLQVRLPVVGIFRVPARYLMSVHLALAIGAAHALDRLLRHTRAGRPLGIRRLNLLALLPIASALVAAGCLWVRGREGLFFGPYVKTYDVPILLGPALLLAGTVLVATLARGWRLALVGLALFTAADLGLYGLSYARATPPMTVARFLETVPPSPGAPGDRLQSRRLRDNIRIMQERNLHAGYVQLDPARALDYYTLPALRAAGVDWVQRHVPLDEEAPPTWGPVPEPVPRARLMADVRVSTDPGSDILRLDPSVTALVTDPLEIPPGGRGQVLVKNDVPGSIILETEAPARRLLVLTESHHPGWRAEVDGETVPTRAVYGDVLGCPIPPGRHEVRFVFEPASLRTGLRVAWGGLGGLLLLTALLAATGRPDTAATERGHDPGDPA